MDNINSNDFQFSSTNRLIPYHLLPWVFVVWSNRLGRWIVSKNCRFVWSFMFLSDDWYKVQQNGKILNAVFSSKYLRDIRLRFAVYYFFCKVMKRNLNSSISQKKMFDDVQSRKTKLMILLEFLKFYLRWFQRLISVGLNVQKRCRPWKHRP